MAVSEEKIQERSRRRARFSSSHFPCRETPKPWQGYHFVLPENRWRIFQQRQILPENFSSKEFRTGTAFSSFLGISCAVPWKRAFYPRDSESVRKTRKGWNCRSQKTPRTEGGDKVQALSTQGSRQVCLSGARNPRLLAFCDSAVSWVCEIHQKLWKMINSVHTRCIVKTGGFTRGVCKNRGFFLIYRFSCGIPREEAILRKAKTPRKSPEKWTFLSIAFTMRLVWTLLKWFSGNWFCNNFVSEGRHHLANWLSNLALFDPHFEGCLGLCHLHPKPSEFSPCSCSAKVPKMTHHMMCRKRGAQKPSR